MPSLYIALAGIPRPEQFFDEQLVNHLFDDNTVRQQFYSQRFYTLDEHFLGPGHPIFLILGGEGAISPETGIFYPFIGDHLAAQWGAFVLEPEHRFYGKSQPLNFTAVKKVEEDLRVKLFTPEQALHDALTLLDHVRGNQLGCSKDRASPEYCPIISVGGSYPGWLSAMARIMFPNIVDMAYAASAPMGFYAQQVDQFAYYNHITNVAETLIPGCAVATQSALHDVELAILTSDDLAATSIGVCEGTVPDYVLQDDDPNTRMVEELMMVVGYTFANDNMSDYPPSTATRFYKACETFTSQSLTSIEKVKLFLVERLSRKDDSDNATRCWAMTLQMPSGPHATISSGDWSGVGTGDNGESWDFQTCTLLVEAIGFSKDSMFVPREWSLEWLTRHCQSRFGVSPRPYEIVQKWHFDDLVTYNVSHILFTNGLKDGWSVSGIKSNLSDSLVALNFPNGAHHSDLSHLGPNRNDTEDIEQGYKAISRILGQWLRDVKSAMPSISEVSVC
ncbi:serine carboxypeptidase S28 [Nitzschia inconspicua]|uniref:Serine carboxypeptidase S28 n=1 Tax=Nitzschia inconspicua TaxID=303405 RepID=A0A9K3LCV1_9STRA|nr:serine carboxypeptidase S28 [Nitzschia inconspicua]